MFIFFDLDDTLVDSEGAHRKAITSLYDEYFIFRKPEDNIGQIWVDIMNKYLSLYFKGQMSLEQQRVARIQEFWNYCGQNLDFISAQKIYQKYHEYFLSSCLKFDDIIPNLERLSNFDLGIISNGTYYDQIFKLKNNNLDYYFKNEIYISDKVGYSKPDKRIFEKAAKQANRPIEECVYIGNSYKLDYLGSLNAGMKAIWLDRPNSAKNDLSDNIINSLEQLPNHMILTNS